MGVRSNKPFRIGRLGATTFAFSLLAGCAGHAPPQVDTQRVKQLSGRGYLTDDRYSIATTYANWTVGEYSFDIAWTLPVQGRKLPLVVYLPGLGETRTAGEAWRTAWAQAGYAVMAVQPLAADRKAWSSGAARNGDFGAIAREHYAAGAVTARMQALATLFDELARRSGTDDAAAARLDTAHIALAGYDVGAYTSMLVAGETPPRNVARTGLPLPVAAVIALSPYADFSGIPFADRYRSIAGPVLSVSGDEDADALGAVSSPSVRKAPFENMRTRDAWLLWLANGTHTAMSGSPAATGATQETGDNAASRDESRDTHQGGSHRGRRNGDTTEHERPARGGGKGAESPTERAMSATLIQGISTAFLDAYLKNDSVAQEWLHKDAVRWLGDRGELRWK